jgi:hypothetical protein
VLARAVRVTEDVGVLRDIPSVPRIDGNSRHAGDPNTALALNRPAGRPEGVAGKL